MNAPTLSTIAQAVRLGIFFDTETTDLPLFSEPSEDPRQPHVVQLAALLVDLDSREELEELNVIIKPDGWESAPKALETHGITTERGLAEGIDEAVAVERFLAMWLKAQHRIAHNEQFDARILRIAIKRFIDPLNPDAAISVSDEWKAGKAECTQKLATPILKLPPTPAMLRSRFKNNFKSANLREAYKHFTGLEMEGAHDAMVDVRGCMAVWFAIQDLQQPQAAAA